MFRPEFFYEYVMRSFGIGAIVLMSLGAVVALLWFFLPLAIYGTRGRIGDLRRELERTNAKLDLLVEEIRALRAHASSDAPAHGGAPTQVVRHDPRL